MKAVFPKNIKKGFLAGLSITIGPLTISIIQLFILAIGIALSLMIFSKFQNSSKAMGIMCAAPVLIIFIVIAFFNISDLNIVAFFAKMLQNHIFDTTEKYQTTFEKLNKIDILIEKNKSENNKQKIDYKTEIKLDNIDQLDASGIL